MRRLDTLLRLLAMSTMAATAAVLAAETWWLLELVSHFRAQIFAAQGILLAILALRARWRWCLALLPLTVLNGIPLAPYWPAPPAESPAGAEPVTIMSVNLNAANTDHSSFLSLLHSSSPDLVLLVEWNGYWHEALHPIRDTYPYRIEIPQDDPFGIALYSRRPFLKRRSFQLQGTDAVDVTVQLSGREVRILGVHLRPPMSAAWSAERNRQLSELADLAGSEPGPLLIVGDFNITPYSPFFRALETAGLRDGGRGLGWYVTWPTFLPFLGFPIDLCLSSGHFVSLEQRPGPRFGSDHYPVIAKLALR